MRETTDAPTSGLSGLSRRSTIKVDPTALDTSRRAGPINVRLRLCIDLVLNYCILFTRVFLRESLRSRGRRKVGLRGSNSPGIATKLL
jgi:hypothetical protein